MRVLYNKDNYEEGQLVVNLASIRTVDGSVFHPETLAKVYCVYESWVEIAYEFIIDGESKLKEVKPDMFKNAFRHTYKNEEYKWNLI